MSVEDAYNAHLRPMPTDPTEILAEVRRVADQITRWEWRVPEYDRMRPEMHPIGTISLAITPEMYLQVSPRTLGEAERAVAMATVMNGLGTVLQVLDAQAEQIQGLRAAVQVGADALEQVLKIGWPGNVGVAFEALQQLHTALLTGGEPTT